MSRKTRTKSKTRNNAKSRAKKATVSTVKSTDTEETVIPSFLGIPKECIYTLEGLLSHLHLI